MNSRIEKIKSIPWDVGVSILSTIIIAFFTFLWDSADNKYLISLRTIIISISALLLVYWLVICLISLKLNLRKMNSNRKIYKNLNAYVNNKDAVKSIQFYDFSVLSEPTEYQDSTIEMKLKRIGGVSDESFESNCIISDTFSFSTAFYSKYYYDVFQSIKRVDEKIRQRQMVTDENLNTVMEQINTCCLGIADDYLNIYSIEEIKPEHYFYYRVLSVLANKGAVYATILKQRESKERFLVDGSSYKIDRVLTNRPAEIELVLRRGKRTQLFSAIMTGELYSFFHEPNSPKQNRSYFSSLYYLPKTNKPELMVVTYDLNCLSVLSEYDALVACEKIRDEISHIVTGRKESKSV